MITERLKRQVPEAKDITKVRITAYSKDDVEKAAAALSAGWKHRSIKKIIPAAQLGQKNPETVSYCIMLWN